MKNLLKNKSGFTMVELMIVVIIVGILAAVAIPLYTTNVKRAIRTEAEATLGAIRSAERIYKSENNTYTLATAGYAITGDVNTILGVAVIDPHYFDAACYTVEAGTGTIDSTFSAKCTVSASTVAPGAAQANKYFPSTILAMDQAGTITEATETITE